MQQQFWNDSELYYLNKPLDDAYPVNYIMVTTNIWKMLGYDDSYL